MRVSSRHFGLNSIITVLPIAEQEPLKADNVSIFCLSNSFNIELKIVDSQSILQYCSSQMNDPIHKWKSVKLKIHYSKNDF